MSVFVIFEWLYVIFQKSKHSDCLLFAEIPVAYLITVALLILPYLLLGNEKYMIALFAMIAIVILIIAGFTYYISVAQGEKFRPRFLEMTLISVGVAVVSFFVGILAKKFLGVDL